VPDPRVRVVGEVEDIDGVPLVVGVDYDTVKISTATVPGTIPDALWRLPSAQAEEFGRLYIAACWEAARQAGEMAAEQVSDDGPVFITVNDAPPHPPRTLADYEQAGGVLPDG
jgi:hypothetical protein